MKTLLNFSLAFLLYFSMTISAKAALVTIPDANFRAYLQQNFPACFDANGQMETTCDGIVNASYIDVNNKNIADITGVEYFINLKDLRCYQNQITFLPPLPNTLTSLMLHVNQLAKLPTTLPPSLTYLSCGQNKLLTELPTLPETLTFLDCSGNNMTWLPKLPSSIVWLWIQGNQLTSLPELPLSATHIYLQYNQFNTLPALPPSLIELQCQHNLLISLPELPKTLTTLYADNNQLTRLPMLPDNICTFTVYANNVLCMPNIPTGCPTFVPPYGINLCTGSEPEFVPPTLTTSPVSIPSNGICAYGKIDISFTATGNYNANNVFTVQMSDASGSFANPKKVAEVNGTQSTTISTPLPYLTEGSGYRIRVISSSPIIIGSDNGSDITIKPTPEVFPLTIGTSDVCAYAKGVLYSVTNTPAATYDWIVPTGSTITSGSGTNSITVDFGNQTGVVQVVAKNSNGCLTPVSGRLININPAPAISLTSSATAVCTGTQINLTASGATTYNWTPATNLTVSQQDASLATVKTPNAGSFAYTVSTTGSNGCTASASVNIIVSNPNSINVSATPSAATICQGTTITLTASGADSYQWDNGSNSFTGSSITVTPATTTNYKLTGTSQGCTSNNHVNVIVNVTNIGVPQITGNKNRLSTSPTAGLNYQWNLNGSPIAGATSNVYYPTTNGSYTLTVTDGNGCSATSTPYAYSSASLLKTGQVDEESNGMALELFPNPTQQDFSINMKGMESLVKVVISDLQGKTIYEGNHTNNSTINGLGANLAEGTYIVTVSDSSTMKQQLLIKTK